MINYSAQEIEEIERQGKKKRARSGRLPDFYNLSNTLRTLGAYLNSKDAQLLELHKRPLTVTLLYQNNDGHPHMEDRTIASFFNVFIEMHGRRSRPAELTPGLRSAIHRASFGLMHPVRLFRAIVSRVLRKKSWR